MALDWMHALSSQYESARTRLAGERLMLLTDIDGTIIDMRHLILEVLWGFDREHDTGFFEKLQLGDINVHENQIEQLLTELKIPAGTQSEIMQWYLEKRWSREVMLRVHRPFQGVLDVIRWFQLQPHTHVGVVTGRPEALREDTLRSLNQLGEPYRVRFSDELLFMNPGDWEENVGEVKVAGLQHFREEGYHVFAFIDNEPSNLKALSKVDPDKHILMLHANTIFESKRVRVPKGTVKGKEFKLTNLIPNERALPSHVQLAWHGVNDRPNLRQFLASDVRWAEVDVRLEPACHEVILRHDSFAETPIAQDEEWLKLDEVLELIESSGRAIKLDLKAGGMLLDQVLELLSNRTLPDERLWFNANIERLMERGFRRLAEAHRGAILQCPIDFMEPLILATPEEAHGTLKMLTDWGINRFSISWERPDLRKLFDQMDRWGYEVNIYNVPDLESFLQAVLLLPRSVTSDFNFPQWRYYGHGSGHRGEYVTYRIQPNKGRSRGS